MAGSQDMIMIVVMMMMSSVFSVLAGGAYFMTQPQEGDECKGTSVGGNYVIDEDGDCVLDYCDSGYTQSGGGCVVVVPDGDEDEDEDGGGDGGSGGDGDKYRYVRIAKTEDVTDWNQRYINLLEFYVYDAAGTNVALNKTVSAHENHDDHYALGLPNLVDGNEGTLAHTGASIHDESQPQRQYFQIDLGAEKEIKSVKIVDRPGYPNRLDKVKVILMKNEEPSGYDIPTPVLTTANANAGLNHTYDFETNEWTHN